MASDETTPARIAAAVDGRRARTRAESQSAATGTSLIGCAACSRNVGLTATSSAPSTPAAGSVSSRPSTTVSHTVNAAHNGTSRNTAFAVDQRQRRHHQREAWRVDGHEHVRDGVSRVGQRRQRRRNVGPVEALVPRHGAGEAALREQLRLRQVAEGVGAAGRVGAEAQRSEQRPRDEHRDHRARRQRPPRAQRLPDGIQPGEREDEGDRGGALPGSRTDGDSRDSRIDAAGRRDERREDGHHAGKQEQQGAAGAARHSSRSRSRLLAGPPTISLCLHPPSSCTGSNIERLMVLRALLVLAMLWPASAAGQTRSGDPAAAFVEQLEQAAATGSVDAVLALGATPEASGVRMFAALAVPKPTRFIIKERDRAALEPEGEVLLLEVFGEYGTQATITTWRAELVPLAGDGNARRITEIEELTTVSGLYKLATQSGEAVRAAQPDRSGDGSQARNPLRFRLRRRNARGAHRDRPARPRPHDVLALGCRRAHAGPHLQRRGCARDRVRCGVHQGAAGGGRRCAAGGGRSSRCPSRPAISAAPRISSTTTSARPSTWTCAT